MIQVLFGEVRVTLLADAPVLVLREAGGPRRLPIWITAAAGAAILSALEPEDADHPSTHDLLLEVLATQNVVIEALRIVGCQDGVYVAELDLNATAVTCRVSDGVALALRSGAPMYVSAELLAECGVHGEGGPDDTLPEADEVEQFRAFLANVNADDFDRKGPHEPTP
nr:bifunctional nuclease family protein [Propionibacterium sp.]